MTSIPVILLTLVSLFLPVVSSADEVCAPYLNSKDPAATLAKLRADKSAEAEFCVAAFYYNGVAVKRDEAEAVQWLRKSAAKSYPNAQTNLGVAYLKGTGVKPDKTEAVRLFTEAAQKQFGWAEYYLGGVYYLGEGVGKNDIEAVKWFKKAADHGIADAREALQKMSESFKNTNSAGTFEATLALFDKDGKTYPAPSEPAETRTLNAAVNDDVYVMLLARGCRKDKEGKCVETVKIGIFDPEWRLENEFEPEPFHPVPARIWPGEQGAQAVSFGLKIAPRDAAGAWHLYAVVYDGATPKLNLDQVYRVRAQR